jgi:hypothetical protein
MIFYHTFLITSYYAVAVAIADALELAIADAVQMP